MDASDVIANKVHRAKKAGAKFDKRRETTLRKRSEKDAENGGGASTAASASKHKDFRAFGVAKFGRVHKTQQRNMDRSHRRDHVPLVDRSPSLLPPVVVVVMGPPGSGKSSLIKVRTHAWRHVPQFLQRRYLDHATFLYPF